jgi:Asp-tRNA(Asn)/Glu-tRNA(Gln) amidotransferase A subunit family amidase
MAQGVVALKPTKGLVPGAGIIPRAVDLVLARAEALRAQDWEYTLEASFIEVYNNTLRCAPWSFGLCLM